MRISVIGLGAMGAPLARRLLSFDHEVLVWNRTPERAEALAADGATVAPALGDAAGAEAVIMMVADPPALREVAERLAPSVQPDTTIIQMATVGRDAVLELASRMPCRVLDAPVLGSIDAVEAGTLKIFVGGEPPLIERWTPLLSELGSVLVTGGLGSASAAKLVANATLFYALAALGETLALADALELPRDIAFEVLASTPLASQAARRREVIESGEFPRRFALSLAIKDADLISAAAPSLDLRVARAARSWFVDAEQSGLGEADYAAVLQFILGR